MANYGGFADLAYFILFVANKRRYTQMRKKMQLLRTPSPGQIRSAYWLSMPLLQLSGIYFGLIAYRPRRIGAQLDVDRIPPGCNVVFQTGTGAFLILLRD
jgi:hypothetical protein